MRSHRKSYPLLCFLGVVYLLIIPACSDEPSGRSVVPTVEIIPEEETAANALPADAAPPERQVYRYFSGEPSSLDVSVALYESLGSAFLFERLCMLDENDELIPGAADRWENSPDGRIWTFYLHPGARWSDGNPVTAQDFEYTYKRLLNPDSGNVYAFFYYDIKGARAYNQRETDDPNTLGVRAIDELTLEIETETPCAYFPYVISYTASSPVPRWQVEKYGLSWTDAEYCVSNSAFRLDEWVSGKYMTFRLNPYYNGNNPAYLRKIVRLFSGTAGTGSASGGVGILPYENGEVDLVGVGETADIARIKKDPVLNKELWRYNGKTTTYLFFRTQEPPFHDVRVRKAIAQAIDKKTMAEVLFKDTVLPAYTMRPPSFSGSSGDKYQHLQQHNPTEARRLMAEAGFPDGQGFPSVELWLRDMSTASQGGQAAQVIQQQLRDILGIRIHIRNTQTNTFNQLMHEWKIPMGMVGYGADFPDPQSMLGVPWRSRPRGFTRHDWTHPRFDELIDTARGETNREKRFQLYDEAEGLLASDVGGAFLWHGQGFQLRKPWLKGLRQDGAGFYPFWENNTVYSAMYISEE
jgi:oligopeptide transport system substrate-binding protein